MRFQFLLGTLITLLHQHQNHHRTSVSIPLRYADNLVYEKFTAAGVHVSIPLRYADNKAGRTQAERAPEFQFLLGTLITNGQVGASQSSTGFNSS